MTDLSLMSVIGWREMVLAPASGDVVGSVGAVFFLRATGGSAAVTSVFAVLIALTAFGSGFSLLLGYSRVPAAAAAAGVPDTGVAEAMPEGDAAAYQLFPAFFGHSHPTLGFPDYSLLLVSAMSVVCCFFSLGDLVQALITVRIVVQFMAQIFVFIRLKFAGGPVDGRERAQSSGERGLAAGRDSGSGTGCDGSCAGALDWDTLAAAYASCGWCALLFTAEARIVWLCSGIVGSGLVAYGLHSITHARET